MLSNRLSIARAGGTSALVLAAAIAAAGILTGDDEDAARDSALVDSDALHAALASRPEARGPLADELAFFEARLEERRNDDPLALRRVLHVSHDRARAFGSERDRARAERAFASLQARYPADASLRSTEVGLALAGHDFRRAVEAGQWAVRFAGADRRGAELTLFDARLAAGDYEGALRLMAPDDEATTFGTLVRRARIRDRVGDLPGATRDMERALELARAEAQPPTVIAWALVELAHFRHHGGDPAGAVELNLAALDAVPGYPAALEGLGWVAWAVDRNAVAAEALFARAVDHGGHGDLLAVLAEVADHRGDVRAADAYRERFVALALSSPERTRLYRRPLALLLAERAETRDQAIRLAEADVAARRDQGAQAVLAWVRALEGRRDDARGLARDAVAFGSPEPTTLLLAGKAALEAGDVAFGQRLLAEALESETEIGPAASAEIRRLLKGV